MFTVSNNSKKEIDRTNKALETEILNRYKIDINGVQLETYRTLEKADKVLALRTLQLYLLKGMI